MAATKHDLEFLKRAVELSRQVPSDTSTFRVGALIVKDGVELSHGFSLELGPHTHAEENALAKIDGRHLGGATIYSSLEPCSERLSGKRSCVSRIIAAGISRVVFAAHEPALFVQCRGEGQLKEAGVEVVMLGELAPQVREINAHLGASWA